MKPEKKPLEKFANQGLEELADALGKINPDNERYRLTISLTNTTDNTKSTLGLCFCKDASGKKAWRNCNDCA